MLNSNFCKMFKNRLKLRKVATIVACLAVTTMFVSCDKKNGDDDDGNGQGRTLTADEKELVGKYSYGSSGSGYWTYYSYGYDQWKSGFTYAHGIQFKSDGTYEGFTFAQGAGFTGGGALVKETANWRISKKGIVIFTNMVQNAEYGDKTKETWRQSEHPNWDPEHAYRFDEVDGKKGIRWRGETFYEKE